MRYYAFGIEGEPSRAQTRAVYPSDLTYEQGAIIAPLIPAAKPGGRPRPRDMREVTNAILYVNRTGGAWRARPHDLPPCGWVLEILQRSDDAKGLEGLPRRRAVERRFGGRGRRRRLSSR